MIVFLLAIFGKIKNYLYAALAGAALLGSLLFATRKKTPDFSTQNEENKIANQVSQKTEATATKEINDETAKTAVAVDNLHRTDSLREQRDVVAKAIDDANS